MQEDKSILIFTPTYNREHTLGRCYESIVAQKHKDLTWLVIDDGSTDNTRQLIEKFTEEDRISIIYVYQVNGGKQSAWNNAVVLSQQYDIFICVDSDDVLYPNAIDSLQPYLYYLKDKDVIGLRCLAIRKTTQLADSNFMLGQVYKDYWYKEIMNNQLGERVDVFKPQYLLKYLFPIKNNIKFIPESWMYAHISKKYKFVYLPVPVTMFFDDHNHLRLSKSSLKANARGQNIARKAILANVPIKVWIRNPIVAIKHFIRLMQTIYYMKVEKHDNKSE